MGSLDGRVAIVTGGASGIGAASVRLFREEGARVVCADVQDAAGEALAKELGPGVLYQHADVSREEDVRALVARAGDAWGRLDCIFNNAGIGGVSGPIEETPPMSVTYDDAPPAVVPFLDRYGAASSGVSTNRKPF